MKSAKAYTILFATTVFTGIITTVFPEATFGIAEDTAPASITLTGTIRDFQSSHADFEAAIGSDKDIVTETLGIDKKPVYSYEIGSSPTTSGKANFDQWYRNVPRINKSKKHSIELVRQSDGTYKYQNNDFFPINDDLWGNYRDGRNYHFTYEIHNKFTYQGGEVFTFSGDDDVWAYIDGKRVIDIGGIHAIESQSIHLDTLGLTIGETYDFDFFYAERHYKESNFSITTTLELENTNLAPIANNDNAATAIFNSVVIDVLANDIDPDGETKTITKISNVIGGNAVVENNKVVYTAGSVPGEFSLNYTLEDEYGAEDIGTVNIMVIASPD